MSTHSLQPDWSRQLFAILLEHEVNFFAYVPDAGNAALVELAQGNTQTRSLLLTTEEEGVAFCAGVDLVGKPASLLPVSRARRGILQHSPVMARICSHSAARWAQRRRPGSGWPWLRPTDRSSS